MLQAKELLDHASRLVANASNSDADYRRAVSASYYAVFHLINGAVAEQTCPPAPHGLRGRFQRGLEHGLMKDTMANFLAHQSYGNYKKKTGVSCGFSQDIADIALAFGELQDARQLADYDVDDSRGIIDHSWASGWVNRARLVFDAWNRVRATDEAKFFLASLVFGRKWLKQP